MAKSLPVISLNAVALVLAAVVGLTTSVQSPATAADSDRSAYVLFAPDKQSTTMSGSMEDLRRAKALRVGREALLYFRHGGAAYIVRDPAMLRQARLLFEPQEALGAQQAALGSRQAELGSRQAALGSQQARIGGRQANARPRDAMELGRQQEELGRQQDALGRQQDALGREQDALGREQDRLAHEADIKFRSLLADAIQRGVAQPVR